MSLKQASLFSSYYAQGVPKEYLLEKSAGGVPVQKEKHLHPVGNVEKQWMQQLEKTLKI